MISRRNKPGQSLCKGSEQGQECPNTIRTKWTLLCKGSGQGQECPNTIRMKQTLLFEVFGPAAEIGKPLLGRCCYGVVFFCGTADG